MKSYKKFVCVGLVSLFLVALALSSSRFSANAASGQQDKTNGSETATTSTAQAAEARRLTTTLLTLSADYQAADEAERGQLLDELSAVAAKRQQMLAELLERDPAELLRVAMPSDLRSNLPEEILDKIEQETELKGELEVLYQCGENESQLNYFLKTADERLSLHFVTSPTADLQTGATVRVQAVRLGQSLVLEAGDPEVPFKAGSQNVSFKTGVQALTTVPPNTFGEQRVLVLLVNFQDLQTQPFSVSQVQSTVFGTVSNFYKESSYQQTWLAGDVYGWYTLPISGSTCSTSAIETYAKQAATAAGIDLSAYNRLVYAFPSLSSCGFAGSSSVGGSPSQSWINGSMTLRTIGHELEHGMGLYHGRAMDCGSTVIGSSCTTIEYGDILDILGVTGITGHSHAAQKERLGWLDYGSSPGITTVQGSGTYWIDPYEAVGTNPKALKILKSINTTTGVKTYYYVEFRRPVGYDSFISSNSNVMNGVLIHTGVEPYGRDNYLLDMTPETSSWNDAALVVGRSYNDPDANVTITPMSVSNTGASVSITFGAQSCVPANPSMTLSPSANQSLGAGSSITYQVSVTNKDSSVCTASTFNLQASVPSGWSAAFNNSSVSIAPSASATVSLTVTSPAGAANGSYNVVVTAANAADPNYSAACSVTCSVMSNLAVSASSAQASYTRSQTASVTAMISSGGAPVAGASVTFTMTKSNGAVVTGTAVSGANGSAAFSYRFNKQKDPTGTYQVTANAVLNGVTGSGVTSFVVQ